MGRETKIIRLPIFDWLRWPSWIRSDPRSGFAEICGLAISGPFPSNEKASHLPMDTYGFQPLKITDDGGSSEVTSILSRRGDFGRVACCLRAAAGATRSKCTLEVRKQQDGIPTATTTALLFRPTGRCQQWARNQNASRSTNQGP